MTRRRSSRRTGTALLALVVILLGAGVANTAGPRAVVAAIVITLVLYALNSLFGRRRQSRRSYR